MPKTDVFVHKEDVVNTGVTLKPSATIAAKLRKQFNTTGKTIASAIPAETDPVPEEDDLNDQLECLKE